MVRSQIWRFLGKKSYFNSNLLLFFKGIDKNNKGMGSYFIDMINFDFGYYQNDRIDFSVS
jgi:predicted metal-dependent hydrolase